MDRNNTTFNLFDKTMLPNRSRIYFVIISKKNYVESKISNNCEAFQTNTPINKYEDTNVEANYCKMRFKPVVIKV